MCGIAGAFSKSINSTMHDVIDAIVQDQKKRGPDHQAIIEIKAAQCEVILGHTRLSIIDLSSSAHQPLWDSTGRYCISYNGEVYNYLELKEELKNLGYNFLTASDTEVILNAFDCWQEQAFNKFNGPFALAIFDKFTSQLWLVRDRFGVKPVYYSNDNRIFYFASTPAAIAKKLALKPNLQYLSRGLMYSIYEDESQISPYENLHALEPANFLKINIDQNARLIFEKKQYYNLQEQVELQIQNLAHIKPENFVEYFNPLLQNAVALRLRSDVKMGVALSGGLDSAAIASIANTQHHDLTAFSYAHPNIRQSEAANIEKIKQKVNLPIEYIWPSVEEVKDKLLDVVRAQAAPFPTLSILAQYLVYERASQTGVKVILGGQGSDEILMGYRKYQIFSLMNHWREKKYRDLINNGLWLVPTLLAESPRFPLYWKNRVRYQSKRHSNSVLELPKIADVQLNFSQNESLLTRQIEDVVRYSLPTLLRYEDRSSMGNGVESRLPFMDYRVVELALALPLFAKINKGYGKWLLRETMLNQLPDSVTLARYKRGFDIPYKHYILNGLGHTMRELLKERYQKIRVFIKQKDSIDKIFNDKVLLGCGSAFAEVITLIWLSEANDV